MSANVLIISEFSANNIKSRIQLKTGFFKVPAIYPDMSGGYLGAINYSFPPILLH